MRVQTLALIWPENLMHSHRLLNMLKCFMRVFSHWAIPENVHTVQRTAVVI